MEKADAIRKVRGLIAHADSTQLLDERAYRAKIVSMCQDYEISESDLTDEGTGPLDGLFAGLFDFTDPTWSSIQVDRRKLEEQITHAVEEAVARGNSIGQPAWKIEYFHHLYDHVRHLKDSYRFVRDTTGGFRHVSGVREARDQAMAELFTQTAIQVNNERQDRYDYMGDARWIEFVKDEAENRVIFAIPGTVRQSTVRAALNRVNGYLYFYTTLFPKQTCNDETKPAWRQRKEA